MGGGVAQPQSVLRSLVVDAAWEGGGTSVSPTVARLLAHNQSNDPALRCSSWRRLPQVASNMATISGPILPVMVGDVT
jgi:hypothetical protein